jgi:hypothetical protein
MIESPIRRQLEPGNFVAIPRLHWDEIIDEDDDDANWADARVPSCGRSYPADGNDNNEGHGEEDAKGGE